MRLFWKRVAEAKAFTDQIPTMSVTPERRPHCLESSQRYHGLYLEYPSKACGKGLALGTLHYFEVEEPLEGT